MPRGERGRGGGGGVMNWEIGIDMYTLICIKWMKKEWNNAFCSNMDGPRDDQTKWSKSDRERQI